jgi:hypothetical protein
MTPLSGTEKKRGPGQAKNLSPDFFMINRGSLFIYNIQALKMKIALIFELLHTIING